MNGTLCSPSLLIFNPLAAAYATPILDPKLSMISAKLISCADAARGVGAELIDA